MKKYPTVKLYAKCENHHHKVNISTVLAPLIQEIWKADIDTKYSYPPSKGNNYANIEFEGKSFEKFVSIVCDVDSETSGNDINIWHHMMERDTSYTKEDDKKMFMVKYYLSNNLRTFLFHEDEKGHQNDFKKAQRPIVDVCICASLCIRKDVIELLTDKMKLYNKRKHENGGKSKIGYFCDGTGKGYVFGEE